MYSKCQMIQNFLQTIRGKHVQLRANICDAKNRGNVSASI